MKVNFDYPTEQSQVTHDVLLKPGENDLPDEIAQDLIAGSEALVHSIADTRKKREARKVGKEATPAMDTEIEAVRKSMKGKGLVTATSSASVFPTKKKEKEVKDNG